MSEVLGISKASLTIEKGLTAKRKVITVKGMTQDQVITRLKKVVPRQSPVAKRSGSRQTT